MFHSLISLITVSSFYLWSVNHFSSSNAISVPHKTRMEAVTWLLFSTLCGAVPTTCSLPPTHFRHLCLVTSAFISDLPLLCAAWYQLQCQTKHLIDTGHLINITFLTWPWNCTSSLLAGSVYIWIYILHSLATANRNSVWVLLLFLSRDAQKLATELQEC